MKVSSNEQSKYALKRKLAISAGCGISESDFVGEFKLPLPSDLKAEEKTISLAVYRSHFPELENEEFLKLSIVDTGGEGKRIGSNGRYCLKIETTLQKACEAINEVKDKIIAYKNKIEKSSQRILNNTIPNETVH
jgi:hypothetical protein